MSEFYDYEDEEIGDYDPEDPYNIEYINGVRLDTYQFMTTNIRRHDGKHYNPLARDLKDIPSEVMP